MCHNFGLAASGTALNPETKEVDARGLSCPEPLMLTAEALKGETGPVKILVTEPHQKMNVEKFAKSKGKKSTAVEKDGYYEVVIE